MRTYSVAEANRDFADMLDHVRHGETVLVIENGKPLARFSPAETPRLDDAVDPQQRLEKIRQLFGNVTLDEMISGRDEGRK
ncbi:type II toxin-antitoxin system Phd/YefM family antitoxin [Neorhizobium galegae]|uniref:type II toxin-antitoxin system Phd/YefM family antitoxin n=1 Tax=Neorhizobium galegae TaxID=399 RepID=UPI0006220497|nr:type II toxin-antitoxin system prevent-host-death family antitoxin [Neorhizobium galegae]KAB1126247.1 type II toxin-antitoxin system prevent-host-death family antitoxin [Neorhizobium galegae]MCQ1805217.1 type II toxin-antitoxin system prevent-host-death family antitoxin [Neorhizobium galegae]CDZ55978.1 Antitoxin of toxin-antitoxin stability system [Neorhizobium galegae bv. orientalis]